MDDKNVLHRQRFFRFFFFFLKRKQNKKLPRILSFFFFPWRICLAIQTGIGFRVLPIALFQHCLRRPGMAEYAVTFDIFSHFYSCILKANRFHKDNLNVGGVAIRNGLGGITSYPVGQFGYPK
ncbi:Uncharacterized protein APZ42_019601 [Daphnia magna]|uniref:Uncharacterized protein n=1 Tax=Daphnia magna TaxID=35525 RepID=A0A164Y9G1_9CRUS|nr:Uncharacterized protein APZ42_019601 [Daphnia magna]